MTHVKESSEDLTDKDLAGSPDNNSPFSHDMTFDSFVPDEENLPVLQMAILMSENGMSSPDSAALFIYGDEGVGKTHVMSAIANAATNLSANYAQGPELNRQWEKSLERGGEFDIRSELVEPDLLIIDDLHLTLENEELHRELLSIIQMRLDADLGVVASSRIPPAALDLKDISFSSSLNKQSIFQLSLGAWRARLDILKRFITTKYPLPDQPLTKVAFNLSLNGHDLRDIGRVFSSRPDIVQLLWGQGYELKQAETRVYKSKSYVVCQWKKTENGRSSVVDLAYSPKTKGIKVRTWSLI
jgi:chromosomal replication initiation ATPase DnaA